MSKDFLLKVIVPPVATCAFFAGLSKLQYGEVDLPLTILTTTIAAVATICFNKLPMVQAAFAATTAGFAIYFGAVAYMQDKSTSKVLTEAVKGAVTGACIAGVVYGVQRTVSACWAFLKNQEVKGWAFMNGQVIPVFGPKPAEVK